MGAPGSDGAQTAPSARVEARWSVLTYVVGKVLTLAATVVLARLLVPADFGVVMLAFVAINVLGLFGDLGLGATLVVRQDLDRRDLGTALTILVATGALLGILLVVLAPVLGRLLDEPDLTPVLRALAPLTVLGSICWFYQWLLQRELRFRRRFFGFVAQTAAYSAVAVTSAALGAGVWSIVAGHLAGQVAMAVVLVAVAGAVRPRFDRRTAASLLGSSRGFLLQNAALLVQQHADYVAVGRTLGAAPLGLYSMAYRLSELPYLAVADPVTKVTFSAFARSRREGAETGDRYLSSLRLVALVTCPMAILLSAAAVPLTRVVYGPRWTPMAGALSVLGIWGALRCVQTAVAWFLNSAGGAGTTGVVSVVVLGVQIPALFLAADRGGIAAVGWVLAAGVAVSTVVLAVCTRRRAGVGLGGHVQALWPVALAGLTSWVAARSLATWVAPPLAALVASTVVGLAVYVGVILLLAPESVRAVLGLLRPTRPAGDASSTGGPPPSSGPAPVPSARGDEGPGGPDRSEANAAAPPPSSPRSS